MKIGIVDYDAGNLKSVETAFKSLKADYFVGRTPEKLASADKIVFPGVGEASSAMATLRERGLDDFLRTFTAAGKPLLAICIGYQILLEASEEGNAECLGLIPGKVIRFPESIQLKVPHMGWNQITLKKEHPLFKGIPQGASFYFVHSYYTKPENENHILTETEYGIPFASAASAGNITATQFHPEKSGPYGLKILQNFMEYKG